MPLTPAQQAAVAAGDTLFLLGPAGSGKTAALEHRLLRLLEEGEPAYTVLVLVAEPEQGQRYQIFLEQEGKEPASDLQITTYSQLAREMVRLFWPLVARAARFERPHQPPTFLGYDLAQLLMWRIVEPMLEAGAFADLRLRPQQIVSQILDTLNRAALNRLTLEQATTRQLHAWAGEADDVRHLHEAARAARRFREHCHRHSLLDLSLTVRVFDTELVGHPEFYRYFSERFRHLLVDNVEEHTPAGQHFVATLMDATLTTAIAYDAGGGYRRFLAADPAGARQFRDLAAQTIAFERSFTTTEPLVHLANQVHNYLMPTAGPPRPVEKAPEAILAVVGGRYRRDMVLRLMPVVSHLIHTEGIAPEEISLIAPYLDGALRHLLTQALQETGIPYRLLRRRSTPRDEPRVRAWLTWLALAHPEWERRPIPYDVAEALTLSIADLDPARAELLTDHFYEPETASLVPAETLPDDIVARVGPERLAAAEQLRLWLAEEGHNLPLDRFLHRLFHDLLAHPPFRWESDPAGAAVAEWLVEVAGRVRQAAPSLALRDTGSDVDGEIGAAFIRTVEEGLVTVNPPEVGQPPTPDGVMVATIYGYLLSGRDTAVQVWLEASGSGWWDIPRQPLSNAFVLAQSWPAGKIWTLDEEYRMRNQLLSRLVQGLTARCREGVVLAFSELDRRGQRQEGPLWRALRPILPQAPATPAAIRDHLPDDH